MVPRIVKTESLKKPSVQYSISKSIYFIFQMVCLDRAVILSRRV